MKMFQNNLTTLSLSYMQQPIYSVLSFQNFAVQDCFSSVGYCVFACLSCRINTIITSLLKHSTSPIFISKLCQPSV